MGISYRAAGTMPAYRVPSDYCIIVRACRARASVRVRTAGLAPELAKPVLQSFSGSLVFIPSNLLFLYLFLFLFFSGFASSSADLRPGAPPLFPSFGRSAARSDFLLFLFLDSDERPDTERFTVYVRSDRSIPRLSYIPLSVTRR